MARSGSPISLTFPPFAGAVRRLVLLNVVSFFALGLLGMFARPLGDALAGHLALVPLRLVHGALWQPFTYSLVNLGLGSTLFAMLTLWFTGSMLEGSLGARWLYELYAVSAVGGALVATAVAYLHLPGLPAASFGIGPYAALFGLLIAIGVFFGEQEFLLFFLLRIKAKYLVAIYILLALASVVTGAGAFQAVLQLAGGACGYAYLKLAPRRGLLFGATERWFSLRNAFYRSKRRRAARKFEVYMRKQGSEVRFDNNGRYIAPEDHDPRAARDPNDRRWMN